VTPPHWLEAATVVGSWRWLCEHQWCERSRRRSLVRLAPYHLLWRCCGAVLAARWSGRAAPALGLRAAACIRLDDHHCWRRRRWLSLLHHVCWRWRRWLSLLHHKSRLIRLAPYHLLWRCCGAVLAARWSGRAAPALGLRAAACIGLNDHHCWLLGLLRHVWLWLLLLAWTVRMARAGLGCCSRRWRR